MRSQECTLSQFADDTNWEEWLTHPEGCVAIQRGFSRLEKCADGNIIKFNKGKCKFLHLGRSSPRHQYLLGDAWLRRCFAERDLGQTQASSVSLPLGQLKVSWAASGKVLPAGPGKWSPLCLALGRPHLVCSVQVWGSSVQEALRHIGKNLMKGHKQYRGTGLSLCKEKMRELWLFSLEKRWLRVIFSMW